MSTHTNQTNPLAEGFYQASITFGPQDTPVRRISDARLACQALGYTLAESDCEPGDEEFGCWPVRIDQASADLLDEQGYLADDTEVFGVRFVIEIEMP